MNLIDRIAQIGISDAVDSETRKRIRIINLASILSFTMASAGFSMGVVLGFPLSANLIIGFVGAVVIAPVILNQLERLVLSRLFFILTSWINITLLGMVFGLESHYQFYVIGGVGIPLLFFNQEIGKWKWLLSALAFPIFIFLLWYGNHFNPAIQLDNEILTPLAYFNDLLVILTVGGMMAIFTTQHQKQLSDINQQHSEIELQAEKISLALNSSETGFWDYDLITNELIWDDQMLVLYGVKKEDFVGAYEAWSKGLHPDDKERSEEELDQAVRGIKEFNTMFRVVHPNGNVRNIRATGKVLRNDKNEPYRMIGLNWDVTATIEQERIVSEQNTKLELSLSSGQVGLWEWNIQANELVWDDQMKTLYGVNDEMFTGAYNAWTTGLHPDDKTKSETEIQTAINGGAEFNTQFRVVWPDQSIHYLRATGTVFRDEKGNPIRMVGLNWDVTKERETAKAVEEYSKLLERTNQELNEFTYIASHDLQEPINTMNAFSDLLLKQYDDKLDDTAKEYLSFIKGSGVRARQLISDLLDYNRLERDKEIKLLNMNELVKEVLQDLSAKILESKGEVSVGEMRFVRGYELQLRLIFQNLISNAIKFIPEDRTPKISVTAQELEGHMQYSVSDNGIGIEEKHFDKIFAVFRRLHSKTEYSGTGIGLAHCKKIAEMHGGRIWVESEPGKGSTFHFTISKNLS